MEQKINEILTKLGSLEVIKDQLNQNNKVLEGFMQICEDNKEDINILKEAVKSQQDQINFLEKQLKMKNLVINGLPENENNPDDLLLAVCTMIKKDLDINMSASDIEYLRRMGKQQQDRSRPILVVLNSIKLRNVILRSSFKLKGTQIYIRKEFTLKEREDRKLRLASDNSKEKRNILVKDGTSDNKNKLTQQTPSQNYDSQPLAKRLRSSSGESQVKYHRKPKQRQVPEGSRTLESFLASKTANTSAKHITSEDESQSVFTDAVSTISYAD